jgi:hypothetical protein
MMAPLAAATDGSPSESVTGLRKFATGVRIDWQERVIEVDAEVALREGPLELLACSPQTREHESVLVVRARPMHIHQAMGLIGLEPGNPVRFDAESDKVLPPSGTPLYVAVRLGRGKEAEVVAAGALMRRSGGGEPPEDLPWVFAGSRTFRSGRFGADADGTVVCVVDFDTALVALGALHSADNDQLWLEANTPAIPPRGTPCTLIIAPRTDRDIVVSLDEDGLLLLEKDPVAPDDVAALWARRHRYFPVRVVVTVAKGVPGERIEELRKRLVHGGVQAERISVRTHVDSGS